MDIPEKCSHYEAPFFDRLSPEHQKNLVLIFSKYMEKTNITNLSWVRPEIKKYFDLNGLPITKKELEAIPRKEIIIFLQKNAATRSKLSNRYKKIIPVPSTSDVHSQLDSKESENDFDVKTEEFNLRLQNFEANIERVSQYLDVFEKFLNNTIQPMNGYVNLKVPTYPGALYIVHTVFPHQLELYRSIEAEFKRRCIANLIPPQYTNTNSDFEINQSNSDQTIFQNKNLSESDKLDSNDDDDDDDDVIINEIVKEKIL